MFTPRESKRRSLPPRWPPFRTNAPYSARRNVNATRPYAALASRSQSFHSSSRASTESGDAPKR